jgi:hypothetical protein
MPDFRDLRTELRRKGYTARDLAYGYGYNTAQVNRFLDGKLPVDDPVGKTLSELSAQTLRTLHRFESDSRRFH